MNPSYPPGRTRRASIIRPVSFGFSALLLVVACSKPRATDSHSERGVAAAGSRRDLEGGTGTRAKGEENKPARPVAPTPTLAEAPQSLASSAPAGGSKLKAAEAQSFGMIGALGDAAGTEIGDGFGVGHGRLGGSAARAPRPLMHPQKVVQPAEPTLDLGTEAYASMTENAFVSVKDHPLSTFS